MKEELSEKQVMQILNALGSCGVNPYRVIVWSNAAVCFSSIDIGPALAQQARAELVSVLRKLPQDD